jgi:cytochrome b6-f complex iron-sulfur subunit
MADEKPATSAPDPGAEKAAQAKDAATPAPGAVHTPGPPVPTPPMTAATPAAPAQAAPAPRSNAVAPAATAGSPAVPAPAAAAPRPAPATASAAPAPEARTSRRTFMKWSLPVGWVAFSGACASSLVATARFLFPNVLFEPPQSFKAGFPAEYNLGEVDTRWKDAFGVWIVRQADGFYALIAVCTHLGCSPNWLATENKFKCPCHGSGFYKSGMNFEGPAPRPLERARIVLADDGQILVDKSVKFQQEKGEWTSPEAFLKA